ncbi:trehalose-phosphatase [Magnetospira sp. QH-2]|uniref:trehalose-phosphatase n=1 Tax=Magnetospira sp. (strain QH-2) TaxID=1288970 RepID=UPI000A4C7F92|nr:trehalose-phosphatase [Magnetospira sp. QH-2]
MAGQADDGEGDADPLFTLWGSDGSSHQALAFFLDVDGTLVEIAPTPDSVVVSPDLPDILERLSEAVDGALVVVSGRSIAQIDDLLKPAKLPAAGLHGLESRETALGKIMTPPVPPQMDQAVQAMKAFVEAHPGTLFEDKTHSLAIHYRRAPETEAAARDLAEAVMAELGAGYHILAGKMVFEVKPDGADKGQAVTRFMALPAFAGRRPVFIGDDVTDEDGFAAVNALGGTSIRVGPADRPTEAQTHVPSVSDLHRLLAAQADRGGDS